MKLKGVNPIEQHIEKIVLGIVLLLLLAVLSMQFVLRPNDIDVGNRTVSPDQVYAVLEGQANQLQSQLSDQSPELPELKSVDLVQRYNDAFENASGGTDRLSSALGTGVDVTGLSGPIAEVASGIDSGPVSALQVPMTSTPLAASSWSTLDPYAVLEVPAYEKYIPDSQPFDFPSVSVEATFSGKDLEQALMGDGTEGGAIPRRYWSSGMAILGFEAQRERLLADGTWGEASAIETPPHTPTPIRALGEEAGLLDLTALVNNANGVIDQVVRPMFPPTIAGAEWLPPSEQLASGDDSEATQISRLERQLDRARMELDRLTGAPGGGGSPRIGTDPRNNRNPGSNPGRSTQKKEDQLRKKIEDFEDQLEELGVDTQDNPRGRNVRTSSADFGSILEEESVDLWAHDLGVEQGATYRYKTRVVVNNPLFRKGGDLDPDDAAQQAMTEDPFVRGEWSSWSDSVVVGAQEYYFVTKAESESGLNAAGASATIELYKMFYGHYRRSTLSVSPGDQLASTVRMSGDLLAFDTGLIQAADAAKAIEERSNEEVTELPEGIAELANRISIDLGVYLLDVYTGMGSETNNFGQEIVPMKVVMRDSAGEIVVRSDLGDESSSSYEIASESSSSATSTPLRAPGGLVIPEAASLFEPVEP